MVLGNLLGALEGPELLIILALVLVLFGGAKLPQLARSLGEAKKEFQSGMETQPTAADPEPAAKAIESATSEAEMVTISREELERLRRAAQAPDTETRP